jgi:ribosomal protein L44E
MGIYSEYLERNLNFDQLQRERKKQLIQISKLRGGRDLLVYASDLTNKTQAPISIDYSDILPFKDQVTNLTGKSIDIIVETPGGIAEVVEDIVHLIRSKYDDVGIIIPGTAKSAGTILAMAGNEILMGTSSSLGPIDAQIINNNKRFSADAFLDGLNKIKNEINKTNRLNPAYIPILQNISPGEIQHCENAQNFSKILVTQWLSKYKFQNWDTHSSTGKPVTTEDKERRANEIATQLCKHSDWLTHGRSIKIPDLNRMRLLITDFSKETELNEAITRYYTLLRMTMESTNIYKLFETPSSQVMRFSGVNVPPPQPSVPNNKMNKVVVDFVCPSCKAHYPIQVNFERNVKLEPGKHPYPKNNNFLCPNCKTQTNLVQLRLQIEAQTRKKIIL